MGDELRIKVVHRPTDTMIPYSAYVYRGDEQMAGAGYGETVDEACANARAQYAAAQKQEPDQWVAF